MNKWPFGAFCVFQSFSLTKINRELFKSLCPQRFELFRKYG